MLTENWKNDLEFYLFEVGFLEHLVEMHFAKLWLQENLDELQRDLLEAKNQCKNILQRIQTYLIHIVDIIDKPFKYDASVFRIEHEQFEDEISDFAEMLRVVIYTVFKMTKDVLESDKLKFIRKYN